MVRKNVRINDSRDNMPPMNPDPEIEKLFHCSDWLESVVAQLVHADCLWGEEYLWHVLIFLDTLIFQAKKLKRGIKINLRWVTVWPTMRMKLKWIKRTVSWLGSYRSLFGSVFFTFFVAYRRPRLIDSLLSNAVHALIKVASNRLIRFT